MSEMRAIIVSNRRWPSLSACKVPKDLWAAFSRYKLEFVKSRDLVWGDAYGSDHLRQIRFIAVDTYNVSAEHQSAILALNQTSGVQCFTLQAEAMPAELAAAIKLDFPAEPEAAPDPASSAKGGAVVTTTVEGWELVTLPNVQTPLIEDIELGRKLGYARPRQGVQDRIRALIKKGELQGILRQHIQMRSGKLQGFGEQSRSGYAYFLTEEEAIDVIMACDTPLAFKIRRDIRSVFVAFNHGRLTTLPEESMRRIEGAVEARLARASAELRAELQPIAEAAASAKQMADQARASADKGATMAEMALDTARSVQGILARADNIGRKRPYRRHHAPDSVQPSLLSYKPKPAPKFVAVADNRTDDPASLSFKERAMAYRKLSRSTLDLAFEEADRILLTVKVPAGELKPIYWVKRRIWYRVCQMCGNSDPLGYAS